MIQGPPIGSRQSGGRHRGRKGSRILEASGAEQHDLASASAPAVVDQEDMSWSKARLRNARDRDFTVNAMMYDPFSRVLFDYLNGIQHCR